MSRIQDFLKMSSSFGKYHERLSELLCFGKVISNHTCSGTKGGGRRGRDRMVIGFKTTCAFHIRFMARCTRYNIIVINIVSNLRQVGGFLRILRFPPPIKLIATI